MVRGRMLHVTRLSEKGSKVIAEGYMGPPSASVINLYNFESLKSWVDDGRSLFHPKTPVFKDGRDINTRYLFYDKGYSWNDDPLRCLHLRFIPRSRIEPAAGVRPHPIDVMRGNKRNTRDNYKQGPATSVDATEFFPEGLNDSRIF
jgi:hypothetical protein